MTESENKTSYSRYMEHVSVTPEMRERVLAGVMSALEDESASEALEAPAEEETPVEQAAPRKGWSVLTGGYTRWFAVAACILVAVLVGTGLMKKPIVETNPGGDPGDNPGVQVVNGMVEMASRGELAAAVGVPVPEVAELDGRASSVTFVSLWNEIAEVRYELPEGEADLRISPETGDNSGVYDEFASEIALERDDVSATLKGGDDGYQLATWDQDGYGVSLYFNEPVALDTLVDAVNSVIDAL